MKQSLPLHQHPRGATRHVRSLLIAAAQKRDALHEALLAHERAELKLLETNRTTWPWATDKGHQALDDAHCKVRDRRQTALERLEQTVALYDAVLQTLPDETRARGELADVYWRMLQWAEAHDDATETARYLALLAHHDDGRYQDLLEGTATLEVVCDPEPAKIRLFRIATGSDGDRALYPCGNQPVTDGPIDLEPGDYLIDARLPGHALALRPVHLPRGADVRVHIRLFQSRRVGLDFVLMPAGTFRMGGDHRAMGSGPRVSAFVDNVAMARLPVTRGEFLQFIDNLADRDPDRALRFAPLVADLPNTDPRLPVTGISREAAEAYCDWISRKTGIPHRLPCQAEWEKAARGTDMRPFLWGQRARARRLVCRDRSCGQPALEPVGSVAEDSSVIGVRDLAGNICEWTADTQEGLAVVCGSSYQEPASSSRIARRQVLPASKGFSHVGFRLLRPLAPGGGEHVSAICVPEAGNDTGTVRRSPVRLRTIDPADVPRLLFSESHAIAHLDKDEADAHIERLLQLCCQLAEAERALWIAPTGTLRCGRDVGGGRVATAQWDHAVVEAAIAQKRTISLDGDPPLLVIPLGGPGCLVLERRFYRVAFTETQTVRAERAADLLALAARIARSET